MLKKLKLQLTAVLIAVVLIQAPAAWADMSESELRLRAMEEKWMDRIDKLEKKYEALTNKDGKGAAGVPYNSRGVKKQGGIKIKHDKKGFHFETPDGTFSTHLLWRAQMRYSSLTGSSSPVTLSDFAKEDSNNFELRRVRMKIGGHGYRPWIKYYFEVDLQPSRKVADSSSKSSSRLIDYRITLQPFEQLGLRVGQWKINYNRERVDSSGRQQFVERSIVNRVFTVDRQVGAMLKGHLFKGTFADMRYYGGVFNGEGRSVNNVNSNVLLMGRLQWNFLGRDLKWRQSDVSYHKKPAGSLAFAAVTTQGPCTRWSSSGCGHLDGFKIGDANQFRIDQQVQEFAFKYKGLSVQEEFHWKNITDRKNHVDYNLRGSYAEAGYFLNGLIPQIPKNIELAGRYAFVDQPDDSNLLLTNNREEYSAVLNYFIAGHNNKITLDYSYLTLNDASSGRSASNNRIRLQWDVSF